MACIQKMGSSVYAGVSQFVHDCKDLKNYSSMKPGEFQRKVTSIALRILAAAIVTAGIGAFIAGSVMIITHPELVALSIAFLVKIPLQSDIYALAAICELSQTFAFKAIAMGVLALVTYIPTAIGKKMTLGLNSMITNPA